MLAVAQGEDGVGGRDVAHRNIRHSLRPRVARGEGREVFLLLLGVVMFRHRPVVWVVFKFKCSEQVHG